MKRALYSSVMAICMTVISACSMMRPDMYDIRECEPGQIVDFAEYAKDDRWTSVDVFLSPTITESEPLVDPDELAQVANWESLCRSRDIPYIFVVIYRMDGVFLYGEAVLQWDVAFQIKGKDYGGVGCGFTLKKGETSFLCKEKDERQILIQIDMD